jgi:hypothetical protein
MASVCCSIGAANNNMRVNLRLVVFQRDVANQGKQFYLLLECHCRFVFLRLPVKPTELDGRKRSDFLKAASRELLLGGKPFERA